MHLHSGTKSLSKLRTLVNISPHLCKYSYRNHILCKIMCFNIRFNIITYHKVPTLQSIRPIHTYIITKPNITILKHILNL
jgi:hypothetical protein